MDGTIRGLGCRGKVKAPVSALQGGEEDRFEL
jgi:hypothetical protein